MLIIIIGKERGSRYQKFSIKSQAKWVDTFYFELYLYMYKYSLL